MSNNLDAPEAIELLVELGREALKSGLDEGLVEAACDAAEAHVDALRDQGGSRLTAQVYKVQTLVDGGMRVSLDTGIDAIRHMTLMARLASDGSLVQVTFNRLRGQGLKK